MPESERVGMAHWVGNMRTFNGFEQKCSECGFIIYESVEHTVNRVVKGIFFEDIEPMCPKCNKEMDREEIWNERG